MDKPKTVFDSSLEKEKEKKNMIVKKIRALKEVTLNTRVQMKSLVEGEVADVAFYDEKQFKALQAFGNFVEAQPEEPYGRDIPVLLPIEDEVQLEGIYVTDEQIEKIEEELLNNGFKEIGKPVELLPKLEEIPIEEQDENKPELKPNEEILEVGEEIETGKAETFENTEQFFEELGDENETSSDLPLVEGVNDDLVSLGEQLEQEYNQDKK